MRCRRRRSVRSGSTATSALSFWPECRHQLGKASLSEFAAATRSSPPSTSARVSVAVLPLLSKQIVVNAVELNGARVTLIKHKDGTLNIADLTAKDTGQVAQPDATPAGAGKSPTAGRSHRRESKDQPTRSWLWRDEQSGETTRRCRGLDLRHRPHRRQTTGHARPTYGRGTERSSVGGHSAAPTSVDTDAGDRPTLGAGRRSTAQHR